ncbi:hypothetical protein Csa_013882 [Cucumis sativus]|uniref:Uncharacterized protein n=1 Tax=Cucumis sativus TaxID=3659 RepID=A0A0A0LW44_CUCSA|nr:hypothetical protein Csa_013882 [Cucumis sativus]
MENQISKFIQCTLRIIPVGFNCQYHLLCSHSPSNIWSVSSSSGFKIPAASFYILTQEFSYQLSGNSLEKKVAQLFSKGRVLVWYSNMAVLFLSAFVECKRRHLALEKPIGIEFGRGAISSMSGMWLIPQFILIGISEAFTSIAHDEFYYKQVPENMRSIGVSFLFVGYAIISSYLGNFLIINLDYIVVLKDGFLLGSILKHL